MAIISMGPTKEAPVNIAPPNLRGNSALKRACLICRSCETSRSEFESEIDTQSCHQSPHLKLKNFCAIFNKLMAGVSLDSVVDEDEDRGGDRARD